MAADRADQAEGNDDHYDDRLDIGLEWNSEQRVDDEESDQCHSLEAGKNIGLFAGFTFEGPGDARVFGDERIKEASAAIFAFEVGLNQAQVGDALVGVGGDINDAPAVDTGDGGEAVGDLEIGHGVEGHFAAVGGANAEVFEVFDGASFLRRVADHDFDVVAAALDALGFDAVKGGADLASEVGLSQAEWFGAGVNVELNFPFAAAVVVFDIEEALVGGEFGLDRRGGGLEGLEVAAGELNVDRHASSTGSVGVEGEFFDPRHGADQLAPAVRQAGGGECFDVATAGEVFALDQLDGDFSNMGAGNLTGIAHRAAAALEGLRADGDDGVVKWLAEAFGFDFGDEFFEAVLHLLNRTGGEFNGGAFGHDELGHNVVGGDRWEENEGQVLAQQHAAHDHKNADKERHGGVAVGQYLLQEGTVADLYEVLQTVGHLALLALQPVYFATATAADVAEREVVWENKL